jgi:hypothetical protein
MKYGTVLSVLLALASVACDRPVARGPEGVVGVWQIKEIASQDGSEPFTNEPLPSIFIFTPHHYSMVWVLSEEPQRAFAERWKPTDAEKIERYNSFVVNSGTYEITESILTAHPIVARVPEFMGGRLVCEYRVEEDTLRLKLVDEYSYDGVQAPWVASGSGLILTLVRIDR